LRWYEKNIEDAVRELGSDAETGLPPHLAAERLNSGGPNIFDEQKGEGVWRKVLRHLRDVSTLILLLAAALSLVMGIREGEGFTEFIVILAIVLLNLTLAVTQERNAEKSLAALKKLNSPLSRVVRGGEQMEIPSADIVPGDILILKTGGLISADARLLESYDLAVDESALTGESEPSEKDAGAALAGEIAVADQANMVFSGCLVTAGRGSAVVTATGMYTHIGGIAGYLNGSQKIKTPLQNRLDGIGKTISLIAVIAALVMFGVDFLRGAELWHTIFIAVSLAVAAVPETLPLIVTLSLSNGVTEMVKRNALIRKLPAVETLGSTSVICTDKTGTLTQNRMAVKRLWREGAEPVSDGAGFDPEYIDLLNKFALAGNAAAQVQPDGGVRFIGDPTETAILRLLGDKGGDKGEIEKAYPRVAEISFSSARKMMTTVHRDPRGGYLVLTKGAFDRIPFTSSDQNIWQIRHGIHDAFAHDAMRIIALGSRHIDKLPPTDRLGEIETDLRFEGIIGIADPPRPEAAAAVAAAKAAGIRAVMITGDHAATASSVARQIGMLAEGDRVLTGTELSAMTDGQLIEAVPKISVYARVSPEDKLRIVEAWQEHSETVAMTGDGVNDAPALKAADVGVAMGIAGTEVAKSAADMVLTDDNFSTIVEAVQKGRGVFANIKKTVYFLLVCNFSEIVIMLGAQMLGWCMPLTPIMLLLINVLGDGIPGMRHAYEKCSHDIMKEKPIARDESLFTGLRFVVAQQIAAFVAVAWVGYYLGAFVSLSPSHNPSIMIGQTMAFLIVGWTSILHVFTVRCPKSVFSGHVFRDNPGIAAAAAGMILLFGLLVLIPPLSAVFGMTSLGLPQWLMALGLSLVPTAIAEIGKLISGACVKTRFKRRLVRHTAADDI